MGGPKILLLQQSLHTRSEEMINILETSIAAVSVRITHHVLQLLTEWSPGNEAQSACSNNVKITLEVITSHKQKALVILR